VPSKVRRVKYHEGVVLLADRVEVVPILTEGEGRDRSETGRLRERAGIAERAVANVPRVRHQPLRAAEEPLVPFALIASARHVLVKRHDGCAKTPPVAVTLNTATWLAPGSVTYTFWPSGLRTIRWRGQAVHA